MKKVILSFLLLFFFNVFSYSQIASTNAISWSANLHDSYAFVENKGQFDGKNGINGASVLYGAEMGAFKVFYTSTGLTYRLDKKEKTPGRKKGDPTKPKYTLYSDFIHVSFKNANPNATLLAEHPSSGHHTFCMINKESQSAYNIADLKGYKKLTYKNIYPNIDAEYTFHPEDGIKYSFILHPGADASLIQLEYSTKGTLAINPEVKLIISSAIGEVVEHAPVTYYHKSTSQKIVSSFILNNNLVSFSLDKYDNSKTVIIDPWVQTPTIANSNGVWECDKDAAGNAYIIGGDMPMKLLKYNSAGVLQWTYNTPWDTANFWLGTLATDNAGNSYITAGSSARIQKVNTGGTMVWSANGGTNDEYWTIVFNCDQSKLIVGGTRLNPLNIKNSNGVIFDINTSNGSVTAVANVANTRSYTVFGLPVDEPNEVRSLSSSKNAKYYYLTLDTIGAINQNLSACSAKPLFAKKHTYEFSYKSENYRPNNGNGGICAIRANDQFVYTQNGATVHKRSLQTGNIITSAAIPGGVSSTSGSFNQPNNNGIDVDDCGNVYVGSGDRIIKYDANLNIITSTNTPYKVFDVAVSSNGDVIICGATGTAASTSRTGYVQSVNLSACAPFALVCCDATVCPAGPVCASGSNLTLSAVSPGGTWSGTGVNSSGVFSPSTAGPGTHTIVYTLSCGVDSISIVVNSCATLTACQETNGNITMTSGTPTYTWKKQTTTQDCSACFFGQCNNTPPGCQVTVTSWTTFATGTTATPQTYPILVIDGNGDSLIINSLASLPNCTTCPSITVSTSAQTNVNCNGGNNGSATASASGGATAYTYKWSTTPQQTTATATGLVAGTYTVTATDANGCTGTTTVTITQPSALSSTTSSTQASCASNNGSATVNPSGGTTPYTYSWNTTPAQTGQTATGLAAGTYSVTFTDNKGCTATASVTVTSSSGITANATTTNATCGNNDGSATANPSGGTTPYTYQWDAAANNQTTQTATSLGAGTYSVTITDNSGCTVTASATVTAASAPTATTSVTNASCGNNNGTATVNPSGGATPYTYSWNTTPAQTGQTATGLAAGAYSVTVTDNAGCTVTASANVTSTAAPTATTSTTIASCGSNNGTATATPSGGTSSYTYSWNTTPAQTGQTATGLAAGTYSVTVTDNAGCTVTASATVSSSSGMTATATSTASSCGNNDGTATANPSGGTSPYTYSWSTSPAQTGQTATGLAPGNYSVTITDNAGCTATASATVTNSGGLSATSSSTNASCNGFADGTATATPAGGTTPYSYSWNTTPAQTGQTATGLSAGNYTVTITDATNCTVTESVTITEPAPINVSITGNTSICPGNSTTLTASGGTTYVWNNGQTTSSVTVSPTTDSTYAVTVTSGSCSAADSVTVTMLSASAGMSGDSIICVGETTTLSAFGGSAYNWSTGDTTSNISASPTADAVYAVTITTVCGPIVKSVLVKVNASPTNVSAGNDTTIVLGNTVELSATGGTSYLWNTGNNNSNIVVNPSENTMYWVTVTDSNGCFTVDTVLVIVELRYVAYVPNVFSPNSDGENDVLYVRGFGIETLRFTVYDRWGEIVFDTGKEFQWTGDRTIGWDGTLRGKPMNTAVFVYVLEGIFKNGTEFFDKGNVTLIR
jgi:gliding motility-associated-like protein